jgi:prepilin-type N-terminal cleavage/methylation domain-containing protein
MNRTPQSARAGFTLLELLAVMVILGILVTLLVTALSGNDDVVKTKLTRVELSQIQTVCEAYERRFGDFPPSSFGADAGSLPNNLNLGGEALVVALWSKGYEAGGALDPEGLVNTDGDRTVKNLTDFGDGQLFELGDAWGNPIAYLRADDYDREQTYLTEDLLEGGTLECRVQAARDEKLGRYHQHGRFQLISAGADGEFGTEDDVTNY